MQIPFFKYHGTGNDFIVIDNQTNTYNNLTTLQIKNLCHRNFGIGADGVILLQPKKGYHFEMVYYNADGNLGTMCGNGARCIVQFAYDLGMRYNEYRFIAPDGEHTATTHNGLVQLQMQDVKKQWHPAKWNQDLAHPVQGLFHQGQKDQRRAQGH